MRFQSEGYDLCVNDDLQTIGVEHTTDVHVELVKLVDGLSRAYIPQNAIIQNQVICWVEGGTVPLVAVCQVRVVESLSNLTCLYVINLARRSTKRQRSTFDCYFVLTLL